MYPIVLSLHNLIRWIVLILGIVAAVNAFIGWFRQREWAERDRKLGAFFGMAMDIQLLLGLLLYFVVSPLMTQTILPSFGAAMQNSNQRFFAVEHVAAMLLALVFAHLGSALARRAKAPAARYRQAAVWFTLAVLLVLAGIPWFRPLLRLGI